jgi:NAD(P)-dependent dehydrogenase (short-subunit alcohol dehydrogenase family)
VSYSWKFGTVYVPAVLELDLFDLASLPEKAAAALQIYGSIDILVNNAGVSFRGSVLETSLEVDQRIMNTNFMGPLALTKGENDIHTYIINYFIDVPSFESWIVES